MKRFWNDTLKHRKSLKSSSGKIGVMAAATAGLMKLYATAAILKTHLLPAKYKQRQESIRAAFSTRE